MKKILVDGRLLSNKPTGISKYTNEIIQALVERYTNDNIFVLVNTEYLGNKNYNTIITRLKPYNPIHYLLLPFFINRRNFSVYYSTFYSGLIFKGKIRKQILTVHDLMYLQIKNFFSPSGVWNEVCKIILNFIVKSSLDSSNLIISVSDTTRNDLLKFFKTDSVVIREGINYLDNQPTQVLTVFDRLKIKKENYFLYVGNFRRQKNISFLIEAFVHSNTSCQLILVGDNGNKSYKNENIIITGILEDYEIQSLYKNCLAFVMPSLYEGFGLPILEAYNAGARVLSSNQGALNEFRDLGICYFSPFNQSELIFLFQNIDSLSKPTKKEIDLARENYSWRKQTDKIIAAIDSILEGNKSVSKTTTKYFA